MRVESVDIIPIRIPLVRPATWAGGTNPAADHVIVRLRTDDGIEGISEAVPRQTIYGDSQVGIVHALKEWLVPRAIGLHPCETIRLEHRMQEIAGNVTAKAALDMAMHDAAAKSCGVPLCAYLGAEGNRLQATWMINLMTPDEAVAEAESYFESGFRSFKVKGGLDVARDVALAIRLRDALGDSSTIYFDHNQGYSLNDAMRFAIATRNLIDFVEEPLPAWAAPARRLLRESTAVSLLGDESVFTPKDVEREIDLGALAIVGIKTARTGFRGSAQIADLAQRAGLPILLGSQGDSYLGTVCGASFGVARGIQLPAELAFYMELSGDVILERSPISDGYFQLPLGTGVGLTLDLAALKHFRVD